MTLVDTSIWVDFLNDRDPRLEALLADDEALIHPLSIGEIAVGSIRGRHKVLAALDEVSTPALATEQETRALIERHGLFGIGLSYVDVHLLASVRLTPDARLWTRDRRLAAAADRLGITLHPEPLH
jgi:predicted nucleic acid-binding protein